MDYNELKNAVKKMNRLQGALYIKQISGLSQKNSFNLFDEMQKEGFENYDYSILDGEEFEALTEQIYYNLPNYEITLLKEWIKDNFIPKH